MVYNLLNFPNGSSICGSTTTIPARWDSLRKIIDYAQPDVFMVCELQNQAGADSILNQSLSGNSNYRAANFIVNQSTINDALNNMLYYNNAKVGLAKQEVLLTDLRDVSKYTLFHRDPYLHLHRDTTFMDFYVTHLKASEGDSMRRARACDTIRKYVDTSTIARNSIIAGDFNFYRSSESGYQTLLSGNYPFYDPINAPGEWTNNFNFDTVHTQSTRASSSPSMDCGALGGMDDRFDFILLSDNIMNSSDRVRYIPNTYQALGNDGWLFNDAINDPNNGTTVPTDILDALFYMSDHLPVIADLEITHHPISLPVQWLSFDAKWIKPHIQLNWEIDHPENVQNWLIERSDNNFDFETIAQVSAYSNQFAYNFPDEILPVGTYYYRITSVGLNTIHLKSSIASVTIPSDEPIVNVYPNPAQNAVNVVIECDYEATGTINLYTPLGKRIKNTTYSIQAGKNIITIPVQDLPQGAYHLELSHIGYRFNQIWMKQ